MRLSFIFPSFLWLLLLLPPLWALTLAVPRRLGRPRFWASLTLRTLALLGLILALAGTQLVRPVGAVTTVFLLDGSDSVSLSQRARAEGFIAQALEQMPGDDRAAIVVFGQRALVERTPSGDRILGQVAARPGGAATNVEDAIQLGLALLPNEGYKRLVLLSDGGENAGAAAAAGRIAAARGVPIDVLALNGAADGSDTQISGVELPAAAREGQLLRMTIVLEASAAASGRLIVQGPGGATLVDQQVQLSQGAQRLDVTLPEAQPTFNRYVVRIEVPGDARPENNVAEAYTFVGGRPRVLLVEGEPGEAANLAGALKAAGIDVATAAPARMPTGLGGLSDYDAVALVDVPRRTVSDRTISALSAYVHDLGRGLMMVGGLHSFGAGGWRRTPIAEALPVNLDRRDTALEPDLALVTVIDRSGSMAESDADGHTKLDLAKDSVYQASLGLTPRDQIGVVVFDTQAQWVLPLQKLPQDGAIEQALSSFGPGGGTDIRSGVAQAAQVLATANAKIKHVILLTDGIAESNYEDLIDQMRSEEVTISTVAIGADANPNLEQIAKRGGGRFYRVGTAADVPDIFLQEAVIAAGRDIVEGRFTPALASSSPLMRDLSGLLPLYGYNNTETKDAARALLVTPDGKPVLAQWQYGLGRVIAWTSDLKGQWGKQWVAWDEFPRFSAQLIGWLLPPQVPRNLSLTASTNGDTLVLSARAQDDLGRPRAGLVVAGRMLLADGSGADVALREVGPGQYRAAVSGARPGTYLVQLVAQDANGQPFGTVTAGAVMPPSAEYRSRGANPALLDELARGTGGRMSPAPSAAFDPNAAGAGAVLEIGLPLLWLALLLLPFDVGVRRLMFGLSVVRRPLSVAGDRRHQTQDSQLQMPVRQDLKLSERRQPTTDDGQRTNLDRLREAQERARRRARGEE
ncbi:MAG TPA: VWA domain-containing protein [Roseiflexaceae bacterium]